MKNFNLFQGQAVIQLAKQMKLNVVNVVRKRPDATKQKELNEFLNQLGADYILTEDELRKSYVNDLWPKLGGKPKLALNCVGGKATADMLRHLDQSSVVVTYGGM